MTAATGLSAPGHLGALTRFAPFELVDDILERLGRRGRGAGVPGRVAVYFELALALFPERSYGQVWDTLIGALRQAGYQVRQLTGTGLADVRRRIGPDPLREVFEAVAVPLGRPRTPAGVLPGTANASFRRLQVHPGPGERRQRLLAGPAQDRGRHGDRLSPAVRTRPGGDGHPRPGPARWSDGARRGRCRAGTTRTPRPGHAGARRPRLRRR
ncbi:hypothetical protein FCI23_53895 [Actinacidiphila oryziradicis]|uniref:Transposase IS4 N-terminal domain-containing protein n=1 Tax=Actinacidiphila oryziradicis TaxID=2571141 RepID=A0A4U0RI39_9ACTN|nr:hypothetical protein FCI23_53895 [Actinacidiphila oryziradicis]